MATSNGTYRIDGDKVTRIPDKKAAVQDIRAFNGKVWWQTFINDYHVPLEQGEQWFRALKHFGVTTEFVIFPRENHNLTRTGEPQHLVESLNWQVYWFDRFLNNNTAAVRPNLASIAPGDRNVYGARMMTRAPFASLRVRCALTGTSWRWATTFLFGADTSHV